MPVEAGFLRWLHGLSSPLLDEAFLVSHYIGGGPAWTLFIVVAVALCVVRRAYRHALTWTLLGIAVDVTQRGLKVYFNRARPALWDGPVHLVSPAMPSGHALAGAAFYGVLAHVMATRSPEYARAAYLLGAAGAFYVGFGRLYLGVHWPSDVLAGWVIGGVYAWVAIHNLRGPEALGYGHERLASSRKSST